MKGVALAHAFGPLAQLLGLAAVVCHLPIPEGQPEPLGLLLEMPARPGQIEVPPLEQVFQAAALIRCFGVEGKCDPRHVDCVVLPNPFNTPGNEVAPRSDVVRKDLQG
jgi:hypothetical protein